MGDSLKVKGSSTLEGNQGSDACVSRLSLLEKQWDEACNAWLLALCDYWDLDAKRGYWVGDEVGGVWCCYDGDMFISMKDIIFCVRNLVSFGEYSMMVSYNARVMSLGLEPVSIRNWVDTGFTGIIADGALERLEKLQRDFVNAVEVYKKEGGF